MKTISFFVLLLLSFSVFASTKEMREVIRLSGGNIYGGRMPEGYRSEKLESAPMYQKLKEYLEKKTKEKKKDWKDFVLSSSEYSDLSRAERRLLADNPWKGLGVKYIFRNRRSVCYL